MSSWLDRAERLALEDQKSRLAVRFSFGDLMLEGVEIHHGTLTIPEVGMMLARGLNDRGLDYSHYWFVSCYRMARAFADRVDRDTMIKNKFTVDSVLALVPEPSRYKTLKNVRDGVLTGPFDFRSKCDRRKKSKTKAKRELMDVEVQTDVRNGITIHLWDDGEFSRDGLYLGLVSLMSQVDQPILIEEINRAAARVSKSGQAYKQVKIDS